MIEEDFPGVNVGHDAMKVFVDSRSHADADYILNFASILNQLIAEYHSPFGRTFSNSYTLEKFEGNMKTSFKIGDIYVTGSNYDIYQFDAKLLLESSVYKIFELNEESILFYGFIGNIDRTPFFIPYGQGAIRAQRIADENIGFSFISLKPRSRDVYITFYNAVELGTPIKVRAFFNDRPIGEFEIDEVYEYVRLDDISMVEGMNSITFELDGDFSNTAVTGLRFSGNAAAQAP
jgi:hypothetical protein